MTAIQKEYMYNSKFREYVDAYCLESHFSIDEALNSTHIKNKFLMLTDM